MNNEENEITRVGVVIRRQSLAKRQIAIFLSHELGRSHTSFLPRAIYTQYYSPSILEFCKVLPFISGLIEMPFENIKLNDGSEASVSF